MSDEKIPGIPNEFSTRILSIFLPLPPKSKIILFGSRAKGNYREGSDIDLAIQSSCFTIEDRTKCLLKYDALMLPWKLDLVVYDLIKEPALKEHIDRVGLHLS